MATLASLPNEVLFDIIALIDPEDLENLSCSCQTLRAKSHSELEKHKALKRKYNVVKIRQKVDRTETITNPFKLLQAVFDNPRIALYPRVLVFGQWRKRFDPMTVNYERLSDQLSRAFHDRPYLMVGDERAWKDRYQGFDYSAATALLLTLLPNLRTLVDDGSKSDFCGSSQYYEPAKKSIDSMVLGILAAILSNLPNHKCIHALQELSKVEARWEYAFAHTPRLETMLELSRLPSVTQFQVSGVKCKNKLYWMTDGSKLTTAHEIEAFMPPLLKEHLLPNAKHLRHFVFHQGYNQELYWEPRALVKELLLTSKNSLERLELRTVNQLEFSYYQTQSMKFHRPSMKPDLNIGTLREFSALKIISLEAANVITRRITTSGERDGPQRLIDILPSSVETLDIVNQVQPDEVEELLDGLSDVAKHRFPKLRSVGFVPGRAMTISGPTKAAFREAGIMLGFGALAI